MGGENSRKPVSPCRGAGLGMLAGTTALKPTFLQET